MLGPAQRSWLTDSLGNDTATWKILLSEVMMMPYNLVDRPEGAIAHPALRRMQARPHFRDDISSTMDSWDGYPAERTALLDAIARQGVSDVLVWTGDIHNCYAGEIRLGRRAVATEVTCGPVTSAGFGEVFPFWSARLVEPLILRANPHMAYVDLITHMYMRVTLSPEAALYESVSVRSIRSRVSQSYVSRRLWVPRGKAEVRVE